MGLPTKFFERALIKVLLKRYSVLLHHPAQKAMIFCTFLIQYAHPPDKQKTTNKQKLINFQLLVISLSQIRCIHKVSDVLVSHQEKKKKIRKISPPQLEKKKKKKKK